MKAILRSADILEEVVGNRRPFYIAISQVTVPDTAEFFKSALRKRSKHPDLLSSLGAISARSSVVTPALVPSH